MKKVLVFFLVLLTAVLVAGCTQTEEPGSTAPADDAGNDASGSVKTIALEGKSFMYLLDGQENPEIRVKQGDTVKIDLTVTDGFHDWVVDEFNAKTERVQGPGSTSVEFVADKIGTFEYYCSVGDHRAKGMVGKFIVE